MPRPRIDRTHLITWEGAEAAARALLYAHAARLDGWSIRQTTRSILLTGADADHDRVQTAWTFVQTGDFREWPDLPPILLSMVLTTTAALIDDVRLARPVVDGLDRHWSGHGRATAAGLVRGLADQRGPEAEVVRVLLFPRIAQHLFADLSQNEDLSYVLHLATADLARLAMVVSDGETPRADDDPVARHLVAGADVGRRLRLIGSSGAQNLAIRVEEACLSRACQLAGDNPRVLGDPDRLLRNTFWTSGTQPNDVGPDRLRVVARFTNRLARAGVIMWSTAGGILGRAVRFLPTDCEPAAVAAAFAEICHEPIRDIPSLTVGAGWGASLIFRDGGQHHDRPFPPRPLLDLFTRGGVPLVTKGDTLLITSVRTEMKLGDALRQMSVVALWLSAAEATGEQIGIALSEARDVVRQAEPGVWIDALAVGDPRWLAGLDHATAAEVAAGVVDHLEAMAQLGPVGDDCGPATLVAVRVAATASNAVEDSRVRALIDRVWVLPPSAQRTTCLEAVTGALATAQAERGGLPPGTPGPDGVPPHPQPDVRRGRSGGGIQ